MAEYKYYNSSSVPDDGIDQNNQFKNFNAIRPHLRNGDKIIISKLKGYSSWGGPSYTARDYERDSGVYISSSKPEFSNYEKNVFNFYKMKVKFHFNTKTNCAQADQPLKKLFEFTLDCRNLSESESRFFVGHNTSDLHSNIALSEYEQYGLGAFSVISIPENNSLDNLHDRRIAVLGGTGVKWDTGVDPASYTPSYTEDRYKYAVYKLFRGDSVYGAQTGSGWYGGRGEPNIYSLGMLDSRAWGNAGTTYILDDAEAKPETYMKDWQKYSSIISDRVYTQNNDTADEYYIEILDISPDLKFSNLTYFVNGEVYAQKIYAIGSIPEKIVPPSAGLLEVFDGWYDKDTGKKFNENKPLTKETYKLEARYKKAKGFQFEYTGKVQEQELKPGIYRIKMYGAQGGSYDTTYQGGLGGYSEGTLELKEPTKIFIYVGGQPPKYTTNGQPGGFNGGGKSGYGHYSSTYTYGQAGGGASDIRIRQDSLYARVIVAGGGGGSTNHYNAKTTRSGGGIKSGGYSGYEATQTSGYQFGIGQDGGYVSNYKYIAAASGGGWYGGKSNTDHSDSTDYSSYNAGGSGYVYTAETAKDYPSGCLLNEKYYLTDAQTIGANEATHEGNGIIVILDITPPKPVKGLSILNFYKDGSFKKTNLHIYINDNFQSCSMYKYVDDKFQKL